MSDWEAIAFAGRAYRADMARKEREEEEGKVSEEDKRVERHFAQFGMEVPKSAEEPDTQDVFAEPVPPREVPPMWIREQETMTPPQEAAAPNSKPLPTIEEAYLAAFLAYGDYVEKVSEAALAENTAAKDRVTLEREKTRILTTTEPKVLGSNEEMRKATLINQTATYAEQARLSESSAELIKAEMEVCRIKCRFADVTLRYLELSASMGREQ